VETPRASEELLVYWVELRNRYPRALGLLFHQSSIEQSLFKQSLLEQPPLEQGTFHGYLNRDPDLVAALIGPEGGFSPEEVVRFKAADFKPLMMGNTVLRVETAALYAAAVIRIILWERASWMPKVRT
jgi:16S rRNA (uracil1498-N3)-methyltransferase